MIIICGRNKIAPQKASGPDLCNSCLNKTGIANKNYKKQGFEYYCKVLGSLIQRGGESECKYYKADTK